MLLNQRKEMNLNILYAAQNALLAKLVHINKKFSQYYDGENSYKFFT